ncbi:MULTISPECIES: tyrosine-type recombinase/integrase [unclassified Methylobacterium]|uniref:tyrosine-type recombinase/integrase n=1 Tax=unclassified Methylobacterium TaxID=2615210 RepID=UPI0037018888
MAGRRGEYLFQRRGSANWHIRFVYPEGMRKPGNSRVVEFSLKTPDRREAEVIAGPYITEHKRALLLNSIIRGPQRSYVGRRFEPGRIHALDDGTRVLATTDQLTYLDQNNVIVRTETNVESERVRFFLGADQRAEVAAEAGIAPRKEVAPLPMPTAAEDNRDFDLIDRWLKENRLNDHIRREATIAFETFKALNGSKLFSEAGYDDGKRLVEHFFAKGEAHATVQKKVGHLRAAINFATKTGKFTGMNPFQGVMPKRPPLHLNRRDILDDADMERVRKNRHKFSDDEWLIWAMLATTGMRLAEAMSIQDEKIEKGIRYVIVGTKNASSYRRVPLPDAVLPLLPAKIEGPIVTGITTPAMSKRLNRRLGECGITDENKVVHSLRHRAKDRLRAEGVDLSLQYELLGHETKTVAAGYGRGSPMTVLKPVIDKIGF